LICVKTVSETSGIISNGNKRTQQMQKFLLLALTLFSLIPVAANAQDAIGTFTFIFFNNQIDVTRSYGNELETSDDHFGTPIMVKMPSQCVFEVTSKESKGETKRWNLNKAFFNETTFFQNTATIYGEKGLYREGNEETDAIFIFSLTERRVKALQYFVQNFCHGAKRNSAF
jgi:nitrate reductase NapE component